MRGFYTISHNSIYKPEISKEIYKIAKRIYDKYEDINYCNMGSKLD